MELPNRHNFLTVQVHLLAKKTSY